MTDRFPVITLNDYQLLKEISKSDSYSFARMIFEIFRMFRQNVLKCEHFFISALNPFTKKRASVRDACELYNVALQFVFPMSPLVDNALSVDKLIFTNTVELQSDMIKENYDLVRVYNKDIDDIMNTD